MIAKKHKYYRIDIFEIDVYAFNDEKSYKKSVKLLDYDYQIGSSLGQCTFGWIDSKRTIMVACFNGDISVAFHELFHAVIFICDCMEINLSSSHQESGAYMISNLYRQLGEYLIGDKK